MNVERRRQPDSELNEARREPVRGEGAKCAECMRKCGRGGRERERRETNEGIAGAGAGTGLGWAAGAILCANRGKKRRQPIRRADLA